MINLNPEIRPEDFAIDPERIWWTDHPEGREAKRAYYAEKEELKRLYELQEEAKAKARFKAKQTRKEQIPFSESLAIEICHRVSAGEFLTIICKEPEVPTTRMVIQWKKDHKEFALLYSEAIKDRLDIFEDEVVTIADESENDFRLIKKGGKHVKVQRTDRNVGVSKARSTSITMTPWTRII